MHYTACLLQATQPVQIALPSPAASAHKAGHNDTTPGTAPFSSASRLTPIVAAVLHIVDVVFLPILISAESPIVT